MTDELFIYARGTGLFNQIINQTNIVTYHVSPNYGADLNTNNLEAFLKDPLYGVTDVKQKYPICVCITPRSRRIRLNGIIWEEFFFVLYFLQRTYNDGQNKVRMPDKSTQLSQAQPYDSWANMKKEANLFLSSLEATLRGRATIDAVEVPFRSFIYGDFNSVDIRRISRVQNDNISGVEIGFNLFLNIDLCIEQGDLTYTVAPFQNETDPVWLSEKSNYYTIEQIDELLANDGIQPYEVELGDVLSLTVLQTTHLQPKVKGVRVLNPSRFGFDVNYKVESNGDVYIESNVSLLNHSLLIF